MYTILIIGGGWNNMSYFPTTNIQFADSTSVDAFHRLRVSQLLSQAEYSTQYNSGSLFYQDQLSNGGFTTHLPNQSATQISTTTTSGSSVIRQTRHYFRYTPGVGLSITLSSIIGAKKNNVRQRWGYFDSNNGIFFEQDGSNLKVVQRSFVTSGSIDTVVNQSSWNVDKLDGSGVSGFNLDTSKANIYTIDIEWLGAGRVRLGTFTEKGMPIICHEFRNANSLTTPYMTTANLPIRLELTNTNTAASQTDLVHVCSAVANEGITTPETSQIFEASTGASLVAVTTRVPILSIRPKLTFNNIINRGLITALETEILAQTNAAFWEIVYNGTLSGANFTSANSESVVDVDVSATTITGGLVIASGYVVAGATGIKGLSVGELFSKLPLTLDINGINPINLSLVVTSTSGTTNVGGAIKWSELI